MRQIRTNRELVAAVLAAALLVVLGFAGRQAVANPQQDQSPQGQTQQPANGPKPAVGEEVYTPKKSQPAQPAPEKKIERVNPSEIYTISTESNLVNVNVLVTDRDGDPISSLGKQNFRIYDDGTQQTVTNFARTEAPLTVCLLVEYANNNQSWIYLYLALEDAYNFLNFMKPKDWVAAVYFDLKPHILQDFTHDRYQVRSALDTLRIPGFSESNLYDALAFTVDRMKDLPGRKAIVVICTGIDTFSKITYPQMLKIAKTSSTPIYPISMLEWVHVRSFGMGITADVAQNQLNYIAQYSGGQAYFPRFQAQVPEAYQQIQQQLRLEYSLGFVPSNPARDGKFHKLKVELVDKAGDPLKIVNQKGKKVKYRIVARDGYYAPKS